MKTKWIKNQIKELDKEYYATSDIERLNFIDGKLCILKLWLNDLINVGDGK
jgi:hypothetical protein